MKQLRALLCGLSILGAYSVQAQQFHAQWFWSDFTLRPQGVKKMILKPLLEYTVSGTNIAAGTEISKTLSAGGATTVSNLIWGEYRVTLAESSGAALAVFTNSFGTNVSGLVNAKDYMVISTNLPNGDRAYSQAQADALFAPIGSVAGGTNFAANTNATINKMLNVTNNGASVVITNGTITASSTSAASRFQASGAGATSITIAPTTTAASSLELSTSSGGARIYDVSSQLQLTVNPSGVTTTNNLTVGGIISGTGSNNILISPSFVGGLASTNRSGVIGTNDWLLNHTLSDQQEVRLIPPMIWCEGYFNGSEGAASGTGVCITNIPDRMRIQWGDVWKRYGRPVLAFEASWGASNRDAGGNLQWDPGCFPSGTNVVNFLATNGFDSFVWMEPGGESRFVQGCTVSHYSPPMTNFYELQKDINFLVNNVGIDGLWVDTTEEICLLLAQILATNGMPVHASIGMPIPIGQTGKRQPYTLWHKLFSSVRMNYMGDPALWGDNTNLWNDVEELGYWRHVKPGHYINNNMPGYWTRTFAENQSHMIMNAMFSADFYYGWIGPEGGDTLCTNTFLLDIAMDPAVICARRIGRTNGCEIRLKPLGSALGPEFALSVLNLNNGNATATVSLRSNVLNGNYIIFDCVNRTNLFDYATNVFTVTLTNHQTGLYRLKPPSAINWIPLPVVMMSGNAVQGTAVSPSPYSVLPNIQWLSGANRSCSVPGIAYGLGKTNIQYRFKFQGTNNDTSTGIMNHLRITPTGQAFTALGNMAVTITNGMSTFYFNPTVAFPSDSDPRGFNLEMTASANSTTYYLIDAAYRLY